MFSVSESTLTWCQHEGLVAHFFAETTSTNDLAKNDASPSEPLTPINPTANPRIFLADFQFNGRGRGQHTWLADREQALLSSWRFTMLESPQPILSPLVGLALFEAAKQTWPHLHFSLKAPNDLYVDTLKLAGLLIEIVDAGPQKTVVVGLGMNIWSSPASMSTATHLARHLIQLSQPEWYRFLNLWLTQLREALILSLRSNLQHQSAHRLTLALQVFPLLKEPLHHVDSLGQLHFANHIVPWYEI